MTRPPIRFPRSRPPRYEVEFTGDVRIPSSVPGLTLGGDLYLPKGAGRVPALVTVHTGRKDGLGGIAARKYLRYFAERGYAVLYVDSFGIGTSEGVPRPILSPEEVDDGVSVVEWAAAQPWCTGRVGMWGLSHGGMTTLAVASRQPPHLRAIFPVMGWTDAERDLVHPAGLRGGIGMFGHLSLYNIFCALLPPLREHDKAEHETLWKERLEKFEPWFADSWLHPPGHPVWEQRRVDARRITVPSLCVAGWRDLFCASMITAYQQIRGPKRLLVGPWLHTFPDVAGVEPVPSAALACAWWDRWLHGEVPRTREKPATFFVQGGEGRWVQAPRWPPEKTGDQVFVAARSGHLYRSNRTGRSTAVVTTVCRSDDTVGALSGLTKHPIDKFGYPLDQHEDDTRSLAFTSAPFPEPVLVAGSPTARVIITPATSASRCVVKVTDVDEQDRSVLVSMGVVDLDSLRPQRNGSPYVVQVRLDPTCYRLAAGHRLRLVLAMADVPRLWPAGKPALLGVRVIQASGDYVGLAAEGYGGNTATTLSLPVCDPASLTDVVVDPPERRTSARDVPKDRWEITRDHLGDAVRLTVAKEDRVRYTEGSLAMRTLLGFEVANGDAAGARMLASGEKTAETADGDRATVRAEIDMRAAAATVTAEVLINGTPFCTREWTLS
ncbi:CocE/NonD family hydrolase [Amycolatopsis sp. NPDC058986]|uniref:CocE/NonD family hydrolase n=1 Tax=unclassified Amycolatopsis TaxID=2618356 RepID=UPI0036701E3A